jgi:two-component system sensor histidine kinase TctE
VINWNGLALSLQRVGLHSLQSQLFACLLAPLVLLIGINAWMAWGSALQIAGPVRDEMLLGSARTIGEDVTVSEGYLSADIPPAALENLKTAARDKVFIRVESLRQGLLAGNDDLPLPSAHLSSEEWRGVDAQIGGESVHAIALAQPVYPFGERDLVIIEVGTTQRTLRSLAESIWTRAMWPQVLLLVSAAVLGWLWAKAAIAPTSRIGDALRSRGTDSLEGISVVAAPTELLPLIDAVNGYVKRLRHHLEAHDRFISNAAHQLKTPITVLNTQTMVGMSSEELQTKQRALVANYQTLQHCIRLIRQLLTLSSADSQLGHQVPAEQVDLATCVHEVLEELAEAADAKSIDLGVAAHEGPGPWVLGVEPLLRAMVANLVDNAIRYTPAHGCVTVTLERDAGEVRLLVEDSGPGIPVAERKRVFERFYRVRSEDEQEGSGLGLAIVREIASGCGARVHLGERANQQPGLLVSVTFPSLETGPLG